MPDSIMIDWRGGDMIDGIKRQADTIDIMIMFRYSAINSKANNPPEYSVLNPDTNSLSPSEKSKGVRFVSAKITVNHMNAITESVKIDIEEDSWNIFCILKKGDSRSMAIRIRAMVTSYEMVWATLRIDPNRAYLEFEDHPAVRVV